MPSTPRPSAHSNDFDYEEFLSMMSEKLLEDLVAPVADRVVAGVAERLAANPGVGPVREGRKRKRRERCRLVQGINTRILKKGLRVSKLEDIGSDRQPDALDLDGDDEAPWIVDWTVGPDHLSNREVVNHWVDEVMQDKEMVRLHRKQKITDDQFTDDFVRSLLPHTWDTVRKFIKINHDASGRRARRLKESKERSKRKERRRELAAQRGAIARERTWRGKPIPKEFFDPSYHSDSENDPTPDLSGIYPPIALPRYKDLRAGADYEMLTPGWRSQEITDLFHWLTKEYRQSKGNRPQGSRYYHSTSRRFETDDIPDGVPRCMIKDEVYADTMDEDKRALVGVSPDGW
ncbi:hypothetical protein FRC12_010563 [Ceratobasidium sp. 428]|nr:hypothetical protein FRC09_017970 [Ceratobasidium sp. 395]KAG8795719.1 hypothetical protein FRC12_010563 [Ceratobasidium sp. 428]